MTEKEIGISSTIIAWYQIHKRDLPWRETSDPYLIWISEIILQQTRVAQGLEYYKHFISRFPDIMTLASATEDEVLKYWQGLGYYSRARNLRTAAISVANRFGGEFPKDYKAILSLKGIGEYTASAIVSFAWDMPYPVLDGNVYRVLSRLYAIDLPIGTTESKKVFTELATCLMDKQRAGLYNQAIMEFGALQCIPHNPDCQTCPLSEKCEAYVSGQTNKFPAKKHSSKQHVRFFNYIHIIYKETTYLLRRENNDIWKGLYEFPLIETENAVNFHQLEELESFNKMFQGTKLLDIKPQLENLKHKLSHQTIYASFYKIHIATPLQGNGKYQPVNSADLELFPVSKLTDIYIDKFIRNLSE